MSYSFSAGSRPVFRFGRVVVAFACALGIGSLVAQSLPAGYTMAPGSLSPDKRYAVIVPMMDDFDSIKNPQNSVIEAKTGRVLGAIQTDDVAFDRGNHEELVPAGWTADSSTLLWQVDGKWGFDTEILIRLQDGRIKSQINVLSLLQNEILKRTQEAVPQKYPKVAAAGAGDGSWWRDGFAVDCVVNDMTGPMKFPLTYHVFLSSDPKGIDPATTVESRMTAEVSRNGAIRVTDFHLGANPPSRNWD